MVHTLALLIQNASMVYEHECVITILRLIQLTRHCVSFSVVESFEAITSTYAQQLAVNETQSFVTPSLTLITELVSIRNKYQWQVRL